MFLCSASPIQASSSHHCFSVAYREIIFCHPTGRFIIDFIVQAFILRAYTNVSLSVHLKSFKDSLPNLCGSLAGLQDNKALCLDETEKGEEIVKNGHQRRARRKSENLLIKPSVKSKIVKKKVVGCFLCDSLCLGSYRSIFSSIIVLTSQKRDGLHVYDDCRESYAWLSHNTDVDDKVASRRDYGSDNMYNTFLSPLVSYWLPSDDINKFLWMVRIGGGVFPHIKEADYLRDGQYRIDVEATPTMLNCLMYKLSYYMYDIQAETSREQDLW